MMPPDDVSPLKPPPLRVDIITLFPAMFAGAFAESIIKRAVDAQRIDIAIHNLRDYGEGVHRKVDDRPFGGGPGMVLMCGPVFAAAQAVRAAHPAVPEALIMSAAGEPLSQTMVRQLATKPRLLLVCGHYEGFDDRIPHSLNLREVSIGDYVLTGGELAAMVIVDAVTRLLPGVLGHQSSADDESHTDGLLEYPHYTRPRVFAGLTVPDVLIGGHHGQVAAWRREQSRLRTRQRRPDLWAAHQQKWPAVSAAGRHGGESPPTSPSTDLHNNPQEPTGCQVEL